MALGAAAVAGSAPAAQGQTFVCLGGLDRFEIAVDHDNQTVFFGESQQQSSAKISEKFIAYTHIDSSGYHITSRIDRRTGQLYILLNERWQKSPLRCGKK